MTQDWAGGCSKLPGRGGERRLENCRDVLSPLSLLWEKKGLKRCLFFFRNKAMRRPTTAPTTSYSSSTATVSALLPVCGGICTCPFQRKQLTLSRSLAGSLRPRESRALGSSDRARGKGGCSLPLGLFSLPAAAAPGDFLGLVACLGQVGGLGGALRPSSRACSLPCRRPHGAGPVRQAH